MQIISVAVRVIAMSTLLVIGAHTGAVQAAGRTAGPQEAYIHEPMPPGFQVVYNELEGPLYADANGKTLYTWPARAEGINEVGEEPGKPSCLDEVTETTIALNDIYHAGLLLPDLKTRHSCAQEWLPVLAQADAKPVENWTIVSRPDGSKQWAYKGYALYTSILDKQKGDALGATHQETRGISSRKLVGPSPEIPPQFDIVEMSTGRLITTDVGESIYTWDKDGLSKSNCYGDCLKEWSPVLAANIARPIGEWSTFERAPGVRQWAFRQKPVYMHIYDEKVNSFEGGDVPGWHNVYQAHAPAPPKEFTVQDARSGQVLADSHGKTIYVYNCIESTVDELACDNTDSEQMYRFTVCGSGNPARCVKTFPYVIAAKNAESGNHTWTAMDINPETGRRAAPGEAGSLHVWAYRDRPLYTFVGDKGPGDINADSWGQEYGTRNGFKAFWLRDAYRENDQ